MHYTDILACVSEYNPECEQQSVQGLLSMRPRGPSQLGAATQVLLKTIRGNNRMQWSAIFTPDWVPFRIPTSMDERELRIQTVTSLGSGMIHYESPVSHYFASLPFCFDHANWSSFHVARTMDIFKSICPCKTRQEGRDNFVIYHSVELGIQFLDETVLAFFKTPSGHNCVADMRASQNIFVVYDITSTASFDTFAFTETRLATNSSIPKIITNMASSNVFVGDILEYTPSLQHSLSNLKILIPDPQLGRHVGNFSVQYPSMLIPLAFPGVYTIVENSMVARNGGEMLPSETQRYLYVRKRNSAHYAITDTDVVVSAPLEYITLIDIVTSNDPMRIAVEGHRVVESISQSSVNVKDSSTNDTQVAMWHNSANRQSCNQSRKWDQYDANISRSNTNIDNLLPCYIMQDIDLISHRVTYFQDIVTQQTYAAYRDFSVTSYESSTVVQVSDDYHTIFRSDYHTASTLLRAANARARVDTTIVYNSMTREETLWKHITMQTRQSCQNLIPLIAGIQDLQDQYRSIVQFLKNNGPCAPGFVGYDLLQDPGDADFADSECVLTATTADNTGRDALLVMKRQYLDEHKIYNYSAQYLAPAFVRQVFGTLSQNGVQLSFCNVDNHEHAPAASTTVLSRVGLWTLPRDVVATDARLFVEIAQIQQSEPCT